MAKDFITLKPIPGGRFDQFVAKKKNKLPKDSNKLLDAFIDEYGVDQVANMSEVGLGDYVYKKGIIHSQNMNVGRNIPLIEDGLKAVERRVLYIMHKDKLYGGRFDKVAGISGDMIKNVHPHGDQSANDTIYRLGRNRAIMIPYVEPKGNFGNMEDMRPAAPRYASASLSKYAMDCFFSEEGPIHPIYDVKDNYKYSDTEPVFLTSRYPNVLMQWNQGIGKGAAAWLGAFNSKDLLKVAIKMLDDPNCKVDIYPDTPAPVNIINKSELKGCFDKERFKVKMRAPYEVVDDKQRDNNGKIVDKYTVVFTSMPLSVIGQTVKKEIQAIKEADMTSKGPKKLPEVLNVEICVEKNTPGGIRLIVTYEKGYDPEALVEKLYTCTSLAKTVGVQYMLVDDNKPTLFTPRQILTTWIRYRYDQKRRYYHQQALRAAKDRSRLEAICKILESKDNTDKAINIIRSSKNDAEAIKTLMKTFDFTEFQAVSFMQIRLKNLPKMNIDEIKADRDQAVADYKMYRKLLTEDTAIKDAVREELEDGLRKYGKDRIATLYDQQDKGLGDSDEIKTIYWNTKRYHAILDMKDSDKLKDHAEKDCKILQVHNKDQVIIVGKNAMIKVLDGFAFSPNTNGIDMQRLGIADVASVVKIGKKLTGLMLITSAGYGTIILIEDILKSTKSKLINLGTGDTLIAALPLYEGHKPDDIIAMYSDSKAYFVKLADFPVLKRAAAGNRILKFNEGFLTGASWCPSDSTHILIYTEFGYAKVIPASILKYNRRKPQAFDMENRTIFGVFGLKSGMAFDYFDVKGAKEISAEITKMVTLKLGTKQEIKFRLGNTISAPVKVFKKGRGEFYQMQYKK